MWSACHSHQSDRLVCCRSYDGRWHSRCPDNSNQLKIWMFDVTLYAWVAISASLTMTDSLITTLKHNSSLMLRKVSVCKTITHSSPTSNLHRQLALWRPSTSDSCNHKIWSWGNQLSRNIWQLIWTSLPETGKGFKRGQYSYQWRLKWKYLPATSLSCKKDSCFIYLLIKNKIPRCQTW